MIARQIISTFSGGRLKREERRISPYEDGSQELYLLNIYPHMQYQTVMGFGGAITDAVAATLERMSDARAQEVIDAYFGPEGIGYDRIRTHIDSCDFSTGQYAAVSDPGDTELASFSLKHDLQRNIKWIKRAYAAAGRALPVMLSPWSPPAFMKSNQSRVGGGHLEKAYYGMWAKYICRYIREYRANGIDVQAVSVQNEPNAVQTWDSCLFTPEEESAFLSGYLYPQLRSEGLTDVEVYIWDHNKDNLFDRAEQVIAPDVREMVAGMAFHWYSGDHFDALRLVRERFPELKLVFSEGCIEYSRFDDDQLKNAQMYGHDMIGNLAAGMNGFLDWNICLDEKGGPNYVSNYCEAPVICDTKQDTVSYKLSFYYISHFSRYIQPRAKRIATTVYSDKLEQVAFQNPDGSVAVVVLNRSGEELHLILRLAGKLFKSMAPAGSISTFVIE